jgi:hypothetical protein
VSHLETLISRSSVSFSWVLRTCEYLTFIRWISALVVPTAPFILICRCLAMDVPVALIWLHYSGS